MSSPVYLKSSIERSPLHNYGNAFRRSAGSLTRYVRWVEVWPIAFWPNLEPEQRNRGRGMYGRQITISAIECAPMTKLPASAGTERPPIITADHQLNENLHNSRFNHPVLEGDCGEFPKALDIPSSSYGLVSPPLSFSTFLFSFFFLFFVFLMRLGRKEQ